MTLSSVHGCIFQETTFAHIADLIRARHNGAVLEVEMCLDRFDIDSVLDPLQTFRSKSIINGSCEIVYQVISPVGEGLR